MAARKPTTDYTPGHLLLMGNSVNRLSNAESWDELLHSLTAKADPSARCRRGEKPFTLFFEELRNRYVYREKGRAEDFMNEIGRTFAALGPTELHRRIMRLNVSNLLTTNYDYGFEKALDGKGTAVGKVDDFKTRETKFSLFRRRTLGGKHVWHIHGEALVPTSIMLGHDHYTDHAAQVRRYFYQGGDYAGTGHFRGGLQRDIAHFDAASDGKPFSWVDLFVREHVHIGGFSFDFSESLLWYLVSYRRKRRESYRAAGTPLPPSEVVFYYFTERDSDPRQLARVEVLESFDVRCVPIERSKGGYAAAWDELLTQLEAAVGTSSAKSAA
jgi:hypothetical protein